MQFKPQGVTKHGRLSESGIYYIVNRFEVNSEKSLVVADYGLVASPGYFSLKIIVKRLLQ